MAPRATVHVLFTRFERMGVSRETLFAAYDGFYAAGDRRIAQIPPIEVAAKIVETYAQGAFLAMQRGLVSIVPDRSVLMWPGLIDPPSGDAG